MEHHRSKEPGAATRRSLVLRSPSATRRLGRKLGALDRKPEKLQAFQLLSCHEIPGQRHHVQPGDGADCKHCSHINIAHRQPHPFLATRFVYAAMNLAQAFFFAKSSLAYSAQTLCLGK